MNENDTAAALPVAEDGPLHKGWDAAMIIRTEARAGAGAVRLAANLQRNRRFAQAAMRRASRTPASARDLTPEGSRRTKTLSLARL
jgi:hypothetical protein